MRLDHHHRSNASGAEGMLDDAAESRSSVMRSKRRVPITGRDDRATRRDRAPWGRILDVRERILDALGVLPIGVKVFSFCRVSGRSVSPYGALSERCSRRAVVRIA